MQFFYSTTLYTYIAKEYTKILFILFFSFCFIVFLGDLLELSRKALDKEMSFFTLCELSLFKMPKVAQKLLPFCIMLATVLTFAKFSRSSELVVFKSSGLSAFGYIFPAIIVAFIGGIILITFLNPISAVMLKKYSSLSEKYFKESGAKSSIGKSGLWLKQDDKNPENSLGQIIITAKDIEQTKEVQKSKDITLINATIFYFDASNVFLKRIDAYKMVLKGDHWYLKNLLVTNPNATNQYINELNIPTTLSIKDIYDSFTPPENINVFELQKFINTLEKSGFSALPHRLEFYNILLSPLFFMSMVLFGSLFSFSHTRSNKQGMLIVLSVIIGFIVYFFSNLIFSLGLSGKIPLILSSLSPIFLLASISIYFLIHFREA